MRVLEREREAAAEDRARELVAKLGELSERDCRVAAAFYALGALAQRAEPREATPGAIVRLLEWIARGD